MWISVHLLLISLWQKSAASHTNKTCSQKIIGRVGRRSYHLPNIPPPRPSRPAPAAWPSRAQAIRVSLAVAVTADGPHPGHDCWGESTSVGGNEQIGTGSRRLCAFRGPWRDFAFSTRTKLEFLRQRPAAYGRRPPIHPSTRPSTYLGACVRVCTWVLIYALIFRVRTVYMNDVFLRWTVLYDTCAYAMTILWSTRVSHTWHP